MTAQDFSRAALPYVRHALNEARPSIIDAVGRAGWLVLWPAWAVVTGPLLPLVIRIGVELAIGLLGPKLVPILELINGVSAYVAEAYLPEASRAFLVDLTWMLKLPREQMAESVQSTLAASPDALSRGGPESCG